jgi:hypothetical protein
VPPLATRYGIGADRVLAVTGALLAATIGLACVAAGFAVHLPHATLRGPSAVDVAGVVVGMAGIALVAMAVRLALRGRRRRTKLLTIPVCLVMAQWVVLPIVIAGLAVNARDRGCPPPARWACRERGTSASRRATARPARLRSRLGAWRRATKR